MHITIGPHFHGLGALTAAQQHAIGSAIAATPGTQHYLTQAADNLSLPGLDSANGGAQITAYGGGDPAWSGLVLISGGWYAQSPGVREIDVNTLFLTDTNTAVGDTYTLVNGTHKVTAKIVGEEFQPGNDVSIYMSQATLTAIDPTVTGPASSRSRCARSPTTTPSRCRTRSATTTSSAPEAAARRWSPSLPWSRCSPS